VRAIPMGQDLSRLSVPLVHHEKKSKYFYVNIFLRNRREAVTTRVREYLRHCCYVERSYETPFNLRQRLAWIFAHAAPLFWTQESFGNEVGKQVSEALSRELSKAGVEAEAKMEYNEKGVIVMLMILKSVDNSKVLFGLDDQSHLGGQSNALRRALAARGCHCLYRKIDESMMDLVEKKIQAQLPDKLRERMKNEALEVEVILKTKWEQPQFLAAIRRQQEEQEREWQERSCLYRSCCRPDIDGTAVPSNHE